MSPAKTFWKGGGGARLAFTRLLFSLPLRAPITGHLKEAELGYIRRCHDRLLGWRYSRWIGWCGRWLTLPLWLVVLPWFTFKAVNRYGASVRDGWGVSLLQQWCDLLRLGGRNIHPMDYYSNDLFLPGGRERSLWLVFFRSNVRLLSYLNRHQDMGQINDKYRFYRLCRDHGLAVAPILARTSGGVLIPELQPLQFSGDLLFKPVSGSVGRGIECWDELEPGRFRLRGTSRRVMNREAASITVSADPCRKAWELAAYLLNLAQTEDYLVQPRLRNHPDLEPLTNGSLASIRVLTGMAPEGQPLIHGAFINLPYGDSVVSNVGDGGAVTALVDVDTGTLSMAFTGQIPHHLGTVHPCTDVGIAGFLLPCWKEILELCRQAHRMVGPIVLVGWDIALTSDGPVLLEGNHGIDIMQAQLGPGKPFWKVEAYRSLILSHLASDPACRRGYRQPD